MAWLIVLGFALLTVAALWRYAALPRVGVELVLATLLLGVAGYAWQGAPTQAGSPTTARGETARAEDKAAIATREAMSGRFGTDQQVVQFSETLLRMGMTREAVAAVRRGLEKNPKSVELWVAMGNALVAHSEGLVSPSAVFAFQQGARLDPANPTPPFFLGLARANAGQTKEAGEIWLPLLARTPADAPWRPDLVARLASIGIAEPSQSASPR